MANQPLDQAQLSQIIGAVLEALKTQGATAAPSEPKAAVGFVVILWLFASGFGSAAEWMSAVGEFFIAGVIYYELEENRAATFLKDVQSKEFLDQRRDLYEAYVGAAPSGASLKTRAEEFNKKLEENVDLRTNCDLQWSYIDRLQYALRWSLFHRHLPAEWFPQALISLWVMTGLYVRNLQKIRLRDAHEDALDAVADSINNLVSRHPTPGDIGPITIYGKATAVEISEQTIREMHRDIDAPFK